MRTLLLAVLLAVAAPPDAPTRYGLLTTDVQDTLFNTITQGGVRSLYPSLILRRLDGPARAEAVRALGEFSKAYVTSDDFKARYSAFRTAVIGAPPTQAPPYSAVAQVRKERVNAFAADIERQSAKLPEKDRAAAMKGLEAMREHELTPAAYRAAAKQTYDEALGAYQMREKAIPEDPRGLVKAALQRFLLVTADIDFDARLVNLRGQKVFAEDRYEAKPEVWKRAFRAGREPTTAARAFAQAWLSELK